MPINLKANKNLKAVRFDGSKESIEEIKETFDADVKVLHDHFRLSYQCDVSPEDKADGWTGGEISLRMRVGDYVISPNCKPSVMKGHLFEFLYDVEE